MPIIERPSPNFDARPDGGPIDILVLHYTGMRTAEEALVRLCDPEAKVSSHYTIDEAGIIYRHVEESKRARHAGVSYWAGERDVNNRSIGIEIVNPGHEFGYVPFPEVQIAAVIELSRDILARHVIPPQRVVGHSDVAPARKMDPGELFPWERLAQNGVGLYPSEPMLDSMTRASETSFASMLASYGYGVAPDLDIPLALVVMAFQRHFRPKKLDGAIDAESQARLRTLLEMMKSK
ncbi:MAG TPA: N-acetylmuramoyl-L-alanine amidase [Rhizomicrobium sp.]|jgi:N-acetylmuramoyl-L-alanine amidase|nr:N-acetylmuramoyl-L-alanine amidase [Rhizomicrobium sp.]